MYVCICNAVSETDVHSCVAAGACSTRQVKQACGWTAGCGSCTSRLAEVIVEARRADPVGTVHPVGTVDPVGTSDSVGTVDSVGTADSVAIAEAAAA